MSVLIVATMSRVGSKLWGGNGQILVGRHSLMRKNHPLVGIHIFARPWEEVTEKPTQHSFCQLLLRKTLIDDTCIAMVIHVVKFHAWQYALFRWRSLPWLMAVQMENVSDV